MDRNTKKEYRLSIQLLMRHIDGIEKTTEFYTEMEGIFPIMN